MVCQYSLRITGLRLEGSPFCTRSCAAVTFFFFVCPDAASFFCCCCFILHIFSILPVVSAPC